MGRLMRTYSGSDSIIGHVVADGLTEGSCVICEDETTEPLGIAVNVDANGLVDIAGPGESAFVFAGAAIAVDAASAVCCDSTGCVICRNPATAETSAYQLGIMTRPQGHAVAEGELVEVQINPVYLAVAGE